MDDQSDSTREQTKKKKFFNYLNYLNCLEANICISRGSNGVDRTQYKLNTNRQREHGR